MLQKEQVRGWGAPGTGLRVEGSVGWEWLPQIRNEQKQS